VILTNGGAWAGLVRMYPRQSVLETVNVDIGSDLDPDSGKILSLRLTQRHGLGINVNLPRHAHAVFYGISKRPTKFKEAFRSHR